MTETSRFWDGTSTGDATEAPYDAATEFARVLNAVSGGAAQTNKGGVFNIGNKLAVSGASSPVAIASGEAIVYGTWYENTASSNLAIPTPAASTRIDRIVLRKDWTTQTVRITRIAGVEGGGAPALVQSAGVQWDIPLAQVSITTGAVVTLTDQRQILNAIEYYEADASADVTLTNAATWYDATGATLTLGAGTWEIWGSALVYQAAISVFYARILNATDNTGVGFNETPENGNQQLTLNIPHRIITIAGSKQFKVQAQNVGQTGSAMYKDTATAGLGIATTPATFIAARRLQ